MSKPTSPPSPFSLPLYRAVWIASLVSNIGSLVQSVGASWQMTSSGASAELVALVQTAGLLPTLLLSLAAGALADAFDRRRVMIVAQLFMLIVSTMLTITAWRGSTPPSVLLLATFLIACGSALNAPAWQASVGDMVPTPLLSRAIAYNGVGFNLARTIGPAFGGLLIALSGPAAAFLFNAATTSV
jgi:MFS family permease